MLRAMRFAPLALALILVPALAIAPGCKRREEAPPPPPPAKPVSIWSATVSQDVAGKLVEAAQRESWSSQFRDRNARPARIAIGEIADRSGKEIPLAEFSAAIGGALGSAGGDKLAAAGDSDADFVLGGIITSSSGSTADGSPAVFFAVDLSLMPAAGGDKVWLFAIEHPVADR